jgi:hypothetical protein
MNPELSSICWYSNAGPSLGRSSNWSAWCCTNDRSNEPGWYDRYRCFCWDCSDSQSTCCRSLERHSPLRTIAVEAAAAVDTACSDAVTQILDAAEAGIWKWLCTNGLDHKKREIGSHAVRGLHCVTRFGPLTFDELYMLGGCVYGEKNCQKGVTWLVTDEYLVQIRLNRKKLFSLHPRIAQFLPFAGTREHRDEVVLAAALESGRRVILAHRNKRRARA